MDYLILLKPLIGALIGYSTNWLAIKMLFKPHTEVRIGKIRLPFTPGVIPRERNRIAKSLGGAVGERLLTKEVISKELLNEGVINQIKAYITKDLLGEPRSLKEIMETVLGDEYPIVVNKIGKGIALTIEDKISSKDTKEMLYRTIKDYLASRLSYNTALDTVLPSTIWIDLEFILENHKEQICDYIISQVRQPQVEDKVNVIVGELIHEKVGALGAMFLNSKDVTASILDYIEKTLQEEDVQKTLIHVIIKSANEVMVNPISDILALRQYEELLEGATVGIVKSAYELVEKISLKDMITSMIYPLLEQKILLTAHERDQIESKIEMLYVAFVENNIDTFLKNFEVAKIVEKEVNDFSVMDIERLIFTIVDKELNAITWFGALLGFVMGIVYIFI
ncbi:MAG: hypothetical protein CVV00_05640 [Firmicutes bacterium HGW-Firmicutes-5]|nr:MAG: hypothetical protein CVV00_05640 [Firmicutes bacterium HGW-Firmicutes-5]